MTASPRAVIFGCAGVRLTAAEKQFLYAAQPWGAILFARNIDTPEQVSALTAEWRDCLGRDLPILVDQEGGRVQRLGPPHWRAWPPALVQSAQSRDPVRAMYLRGRLIAAELAALGINVNCAPLADIARADTHAILRNRCYGQTLDQVVALARAMADGLRDGGVLPVLKHMPGHGRATLDSHLALPVVTQDAATLRAQDFAAFAALSDLPLAMSAHIVFSAIDPAQPATTSPAMIRLIRDEIGFDGALMTDDLSMQALSGSLATRAQAALAAGCDLVLHCNGVLDEMQQLAEVCPALAGPALDRCAGALAGRHAPIAADLSELADEYDTLIAEARA
ncbi:MAG: beta-N-acetylhexosaminidase NagZ [Roseibaca calidilacus]|uniref:beta-N-acetylhexosaminidase n=1 Tax=Roseibaca calidilacus TaxID=1666912 RepID=A0A0P7WCE3_9RHOB|nr:beta-N-acetylhexosaminidase [Roseibaca calidilacus]KPP95635.1 MAG: beta-N-acetylhexosaminidase NagZ [Roseibaca calidilacus]CUX81968.1 beta-N-acetylhexosaminidase [Roseibaca calidilacus]